MTSLTREEIKDRFPITREQVEKYLKRRGLPFKRAQRLKARKAIRERKIRKTVGKEYTETSTSAPWQIIYGKTRVGGLLSFIEAVNNNQDLLLFVTVAAHEIESIENIYFDDEEIVFGGDGWADYSVRPDGETNTRWENKVYYDVQYGTTGQSALASLVSDSDGLWTSTDKQAGRAGVYLKLKWDVTLFPNGIPDISFVVKGKKVYDPRTTTTVWSENPALIVGDILLNDEYGYGIALANIDSTTWEAAADTCEESITLLDSGTEDRYTCNGIFSSDESPQDMLEIVLSSMLGDLVKVEDTWKIYAGEYIAPSITLDEDDFLSPLTIKTKLSRRDTFNGIRGTFVDPDADYEEKEFSPYVNDYYKGLDNGERIWEDVQFPMTVSEPACQRMGKALMEAQRQGIQFETTCSLKAFQLEPVHTCYISYERLGWSSKVFRVEELELVVDEGGDNSAPRLAVKAVFRETASAVWDWNNGSQTRRDLAPNSNLPSPFDVSAPTGVALASGTDQLYLRGDGTVFSRIKVSWDAMSDAFVSSGGRIEIQFKKSSASTWQDSTAVPGTSEEAYILDVQDGVEYDVRIRAVNALGVESSYSTVTNHMVLGKTDPPADVQGFRAQTGAFGIFFFWNEVPDKDLSHYELRQGDTDDSWSDSAFLAEIKGTSYQLEIKTAGSYRFQIKAVDTTGNYSQTAGLIDTTIGVPSAVSASYQIVGANALIEWTESTGLFAIEEYLILYGNSYNTAVGITRVKGRSLSVKLDFSGQRRYWVVAKDVAGNLGTEAYIDVTVTPPSQVQGMEIEVVDNNVLLKWTAPAAGTLPIDHYKVYKGEPFGSATLIGEVRGTFAAIFEVESGTYTYWIAAVDSAGNAGEAQGRTATVSEPPDFIIVDDDVLVPSSGTGINVDYDGEKMFMPANATESWEAHFLNNGWSTIQDAIDAGNTKWLQPVPDNAYWEYTIDYGTTLPPSIVKFGFVQNNVSGSPSFTTYIGLSTDGTTWDTEAATQRYVSSARYVKVRIEKGTFGVSGSPRGLLLALTEA